MFQPPSAAERIVNRAFGLLVGGIYGVAGLKAALDLSGYNGGVPRPPLRPAPPPVVETIRGQLAALGAFKALTAEIH